MTTYQNCYQLVGDVRLGLNEYDEAKVKGTDLTGAYHNRQIIRAINNAQRFLYGMLIKRIPGQFLAATSLTGVNSVFTIPANYGRLILFRDDKRRKVYPIEQDQRTHSSSGGSDRMYYRKGKTLVLDKSGITKTYTLIYQTKPRDIHMGMASAGDALSITLDTNQAPKIVDYYNGMTIENRTQDWADTIDDYTAARVATISAETAAANDYYGLVSELPEWCHHLMAPKAVIELKSSPISQEPPTKFEKGQFDEDLITTLRGFAAPDSEDQDMEELFTRYEPNVSVGMGIVAND